MVPPQSALMQRRESVASITRDSTDDLRRVPVKGERLQLEFSKSPVPSPLHANQVPQRSMGWRQLTTPPDAKGLDGSWRLHRKASYRRWSDWKLPNGDVRGYMAAPPAQKLSNTVSTLSSTDKGRSTRQISEEEIMRTIPEASVEHRRKKLTPEEKAMQKQRLDALYNRFYTEGLQKTLKKKKAYDYVQGELRREYVSGLHRTAEEKPPEEEKGSTEKKKKKVRDTWKGSWKRSGWNADAVYHETPSKKISSSGLRTNPWDRQFALAVIKQQRERQRQAEEEVKQMRKAAAAHMTRAGCWDRLCPPSKPRPKPSADTKTGRAEKPKATVPHVTPTIDRLSQARTQRRFKSKECLQALADEEAHQQRLAEYQARYHQHALRRSSTANAETPKKPRTANPRSRSAVPQKAVRRRGDESPEGIALSGSVTLLRPRPPRHADAVVLDKKVARPSEILADIDEGDYEALAAHTHPSSSVYHSGPSDDPQLAESQYSHSSVDSLPLRAAHYGGIPPPPPYDCEEDLAA